MQRAISPTGTNKVLFLSNFLSNIALHCNLSTYLWKAVIIQCSYLMLPSVGQLHLSRCTHRVQYLSCMLGLKSREFRMEQLSLHVSIMQSCVWKLCYTCLQTAAQSSLLDVTECLLWEPHRVDVSSGVCRSSICWKREIVSNNSFSTQTHNSYREEI